MASSSSVYGNCKEVPFKESFVVDYAISPYAATKKANEALIFIMCYTIIIFVGAIGIVMSGTDITTAWTAAIACMGNVGPGMGSIGSMDNYSHLPIIAKYISMILMIVGRLEIFPILYVLRIK